MVRGSKKNLLTLAGVLVVVFSLDQWTKALICSHFHLGETLPLLDDVFALTYYRNQGAAFSLFNSAPAAFRDPFFLTIPIIALTVILVLLIRNPRFGKIRVFALSLVASGALGNFADRVRFGYVVDFLDFHIRPFFQWPMFNVADSCIVIGVSLLFLQSLKKQNREHPRFEE